MQIEYLDRSVRDAFSTAELRDWRSHDPFDLLLSPSLDGLQRRSRTLARVAVQVGLRSGVRLRSLLRVPVHQEPKALADFLRSAIRLTRLGRGWATTFIEPLASGLVASAHRSDTTYAWGLGFPYTSRFANAPTGTPNTYVTLAVLDALIDTFELTEDVAILNIVAGGCRFLHRGLGIFEHQGRTWMRYWPGSYARIVNIQPAAASVLSRAAGHLGDAALKQLADELVQTTLSAQRTNGSWSYSDDGQAAFVDGFHSGFVLQGLAEYVASQQQHAPAAKVAVEQGLRYFQHELLAPGGLPRGVAGGGVSLDAQNVAQCAQTLVVCSQDPVDREAAVHMWDAVAQLGKSPLDLRVSLLSLRWSLGPGVLAATHLLGELALRV